MASSALKPANNTKKSQGNVLPWAETNANTQKKHSVHSKAVLPDAGNRMKADGNRTAGSGTSAAAKRDTG